MISLKEKNQQFNQRWNLPEEKFDADKEFSKFKIRILNDMKGIDNNVLRGSISQFCKFFGIEEIWEKNIVRDTRWSKNIIKYLENENDEIKFYKILEIIFSLNLRERRDGYGPYARVVFNKQILYKLVKESITYSNVNLEMTMLDSGEVILYPKGEEKLDDEIVNTVLSFLDEKCNAHYIDALSFYKDKNHVKSAESLRRTLEEYLRSKLNNNKGLAANKNEITKILKTQEVDSQIRKIISQIFGYLDIYFNENSKHNDGELKEYDNEFLIYQVGLMLRYIHQIS